MLYELGQLGLGTTGVTAWTLLTFATPGRVRLLELGAFNNAGTASIYGFGRPAAVGITPTTPVDFLPQDPTDALAASSLQGVVAGWGTGPTVPTNFLRRWATGAAVGSGIILTWPRGLVCSISGNLVIWNTATNSAPNVYAVCEI